MHRIDLKRSWTWVESSQSRLVAALDVPKDSAIFVFVKGISRHRKGAKATTKKSIDNRLNTTHVAMRVKHLKPFCLHDLCPVVIMFARRWSAVRSWTVYLSLCAQLPALRLFIPLRPSCISSRERGSLAFAKRGINSFYGFILIIFLSFFCMLFCLIIFDVWILYLHPLST